MFKIIKDNRGQAAVEYIFLLVAVAAILFSVLSKLRTELIGDLSNCGKTPLAPVCIFKNTFNADMNFKYFNLRR